LRRRPHGDEHDRKDNDDLTPKNFGRRHDDQESSVACVKSKCRISSGVRTATAGYDSVERGTMPSKVCYRRQPGIHLRVGSISNLCRFFGRQNDDTSCVGHAAAAHRRSAGHQRPQHLFPRRRSRLRPENRCLTPFNGFVEYAPELVRAQRRSAAVFLRGIWIEFKGDGGMKSKLLPGPRSMAS
jgi:hypothetical protein